MHVRDAVRAAGLLFASAFALLAPPPEAAAQQREPYRITGIVVDQRSNQPLPGVQVALRDSRLGTLTNSEGRYTLAAPVAAGTYTLEYSFIGRETETQRVTLAGERAVELPPVQMTESAVEMQEIVVTSTGVRAERRAVPNAVEQVRGEEINEAPGAASVDQALQGKVTGAVISETSGQPGGGTTIRLRGPSSIFGSQEPLIVVDGVIIDNSDEALVSLSANAGRGSAALSNRLADISTSDIDRVTVLKGAAAAALYGSRANNGVIQIFTKQGQQGAPKINFRTEFSANETPKRYDLLMFPEAGFADVLFAGADSIGAPVERFDIQDEIFRTGLGTSNHLSISGANEGTSYYVAGAYRNEEGIVVGTDHQKVNVQGKITQMISDRVEITLNGNFIESETEFVPEGEQTTGVLTSVIFTPTSFDPHFNEETGRFPANPVLGANPLQILAEWEAPQEVTRFLGNFETVWRPMDRLTVRYLFGIDDYRMEHRFFQPPGSTSPSDPGLIQNPVRLSRQMNHDVTLAHEAALGERLGLGSTVGFRAFKDRAESIRAAASDLPPGTRVISGATQFASQGITEVNTLGGFIEERLSIADRLFLTGALNVEGSSSFGADQRWQMFPRLGVSWLASDEPFLRDRGIVDGILSTLRLRASYGETGGQPFGAFLRLENYVPVVFSSRSGFVASTTLGNPDLEPERQQEWEVGLDAGLFGDRVELEFTYYDQTSEGLILPVPQPPSRGAQVQYQNIGVLANHGIEAALNTVNVSRSNLRWSSRLSFSRNDNVVETLVAGDTLVFGYLNAAMEGQPLGVFFGRFYARNPDGTIQYREVTVGGQKRLYPATALDTLPNGQTTAARKVLGNPNPDFNLSFNNTFDIGESLTLNVLFDGRFGNEVANFTRRITELFGVDPVVQREITGDTIFRTFTLNPAGRSLIYEEYIEDGSFVKLREIGLSYTFGPEWARRVGGAEAIDLRVAARNLYTWTDYSGLDPEINLFAANPVAQGVDFANTPIPRTFLVSLNFHF